MAYLLEAYVGIYVPYKKSLASTMWLGGLYTYLVNYIPCYWHRSLNKFGCHFANIGHTLFILYGCRCDIGAYMCQTTINCNFYFTYIAIYVPETNMLATFHIYAISLRDIWGIWICIYASYMRWVASTMGSGILYIHV